MFLWLKKFLNFCGQSSCNKKTISESSYDLGYSEYYCETCKKTRCHQIIVNLEKITPLDSNIKECLCCKTRNK